MENKLGDLESGTGNEIDFVHSTSSESSDDSFIHSFELLRTLKCTKFQSSDASGSENHENSEHSSLASRDGATGAAEKRVRAMNSWTCSYQNFVEKEMPLGDTKYSSGLATNGSIDTKRLKPMIPPYASRI
ncbi:hypothetical protein AVEN_272698-1 [Araneus ventricosus]|uniref:Uncharacterized protein n=1 Tax=Araneus ventricosus TaxID=182803 RepID=A0A4Y2LB78_ARAVE|nr:hypothetical protein AVEN_272698-1 [Araneus ventricosus]